MIPTGYSLTRQDLEEIAEAVVPLGPALQGASLLVTGGTGFFGMWLVEGLLWADAALGLKLRVTALSRDVGRFLGGRGRHLVGHPRLDVIEGDIAAFDPGPRRFTHIIHAATEGYAGHSASRHLDAAVDGTRHVIALAAAHRTAAVLLTSSGAVYRPLDPPSEPSREAPRGTSDYTEYRHFYAEAKRMMETMLAAGAERHGFRGAIARCFAFTGAWLPLDGGLAMGNFVRDALRGRTVAVGGDGTALRSYLYGTDLVVWLLTVLLKGESCRPYNVGGADPVSIADLARLVAAEAGRPGDVAIARAPMPGTAPDTYLPDLSRTTGELGVKVSVELQEAVRRTLAWHHGRGAG
ncbi:MAG: NAD-dependent epimerase/dehydratase family protein [Sphingomonadales bacterium]